MHHRFLLFLLLLPIAEISAMETMSDDMIIYNVSPNLDRLKKIILDLPIRDTLSLLSLKAS